MGTLLSLLRQFRLQLENPLLPLPDPKVVRRRLFSGAKSTVRRSRRIAAKDKGIPISAVKKAQRLLMQQLGICCEGERLSATHLQEFTKLFASPLGPEQVAALAALFGISCPRVDEATLASGVVVA
jgi:hypothetical protein